MPYPANIQNGADITSASFPSFGGGVFKPNDVVEVGSTLYVALLDNSAVDVPTNSNRVGMFKSTDSGLTWTEMDSANGPRSGGIPPTVISGKTESLKVFVKGSGGVLYTITRDPATKNYAVTSFSTSSDTWGVPTVTAVPIPNPPPGPGICAFYRVVDNVILIADMTGDGTATPYVSRYFVFDIGTLTASGYTDIGTPTAGTNWTLGGIVQGSGNGALILVCVSDFPSTGAENRELQVIPMTSANTQGTAVIVDATTGASMQFFAWDISSDGNTVGVIWAPDGNDLDNLNVYRGTALPLAFDAAQILNMGGGGNFWNVFSIAVGDFGIAAFVQLIDASNAVFQDYAVDDGTGLGVLTLGYAITPDNGGSHRMYSAAVAGGVAVLPDAVSETVAPFDSLMLYALQALAAAPVLPAVVTHNTAQGTLGGWWPLISQKDPLVMNESMEAYAVRVAREHGQQYRVPCGYWDRHFYYIYDGTGGTLTPALTAGGDYAGLSILLYPDSDFILRRVSWVSTSSTSASPASSFNFYWGQKLYAWYNNLFYTVCDIPVMPEIGYPAAGQIQFNITNYAPHVNAGAGEIPDVPFGQFVFQGVQRIKGEQKDMSTYPVARRVYQVYNIDIALNFSYYNFSGGIPTGVAPTKIFQAYVNEGDFELWAIQTDGGERVKFNLIDPIDKTVFTNQIPIVASVFMDGTAASSSGQVQQDAGLWGAIVPPKLYPLGSYIQIEVQSLIPGEHPDETVQFNFIGMSRKPK